jgi:hypothetical protein
MCMEVFLKSLALKRKIWEGHFQADFKPKDPRDHKTIALVTWAATIQYEVFLHRYRCVVFLFEHRVQTIIVQCVLMWVVLFLKSITGEFLFARCKEQSNASAEAHAL